MDRRQRQVIDAFERVQAFVDSHPLAGGASYGVPRELLGAIVARIDSHGTTQESGTRQERGDVVRQRVLARTLREGHLRPIAQIARAVLEYRPELDVILRAPSHHFPIRALLTRANAIRELAAKHETTLATNGCGPDFLPQLDAAIAALRESMVDRAQSTGTRVGARQGLDLEIRRGRDALRMLDAVVRRHFAGDAEALAAWRVARRVRAIAGGAPRPASGAAPGDGTPSPAAA